MIREGYILPEDVRERLPVLIEQVEKDQDIVALYVFGSLAAGDLKPLSDLDFGTLISGKLIHCMNKIELIDFIEKTIKLYLDFRFFRDTFDDTFLKGIGYSG